MSIVDSIGNHYFIGNGNSMSFPRNSMELLLDQKSRYSISIHRLKFNQLEKWEKPWNLHFPLEYLIFRMPMKFSFNGNWKLIPFSVTIEKVVSKILYCYFNFFKRFTMLDNFSSGKERMEKEFSNVLQF